MRAIFLVDSRIVFRNDSSIVEVEIRDTVFIVRRPHPDPQRTQVDSGYMVGKTLFLPTILYFGYFGGGQSGYPTVLQYEITR